MVNPLVYVLVPLMAMLLVTAQAFWGTAIKNQHLLHGAPSKIVYNLISSPRIWVGVLIYVLATAVYFILLSKIKFFSVQVSMTAISILFSTLLAATLFDEKISLLNIFGMLLVLSGLPLVIFR